MKNSPNHHHLELLIIGGGGVILVSLLNRESPLPSPPSCWQFPTSSAYLTHREHDQLYKSNKLISK